LTQPGAAIGDVPPPETEAGAPILRFVFGVGALALFRWSLFSVATTSTTAEEQAQEKLRQLIETSQSALRERRYEEALSPLIELNELQPKNQVYWWQRATVYDALRRLQDEIDALEHYVKIAPIPGEACPQLPFLYTGLGQKSEALDAFKRCAAFSPNNTEDAFYYGYALEHEDQVDRALDVYTEASKKSPNSDVFAGMGRMLLRKGKPKDAYQIISPVLARNPNNVDALLVAGIALYRLGKPAEAKVLLERGAARHDDSDFRFALGAVAEMQGRQREAVAQYEASLRLDPNNKDARLRRSRFWPPLPEPPPHAAEPNDR
jgi:tetratricopeptide (TPR) repeat protein